MIIFRTVIVEGEIDENALPINGDETSFMSREVWVEAHKPHSICPDRFNVYRRRLWVRDPGSR